MIAAAASVSPAVKGLSSPTLVSPLLSFSTLFSPISSLHRGFRLDLFRLSKRGCQFVIMSCRRANEWVARASISLSHFPFLCAARDG